MTSPAASPALWARLALAALVATAWLAVPAFGQTCQGQTAINRDPSEPSVLVELFTSEGCSDCPPADALLERLDATQFIPGARAIVLSEHVTYWNHLGWRDPFSLDEMDERQRQYEEQFGLSSSYTPQMVVDGAVQFVGNNSARLSSAMSSAASKPKRKIEIEDAHWADGAVHFSVRGNDSSGTTLVAALAQDATRSEVARGENAGRTLHHVAVVRAIKEFGSKSTDGRPLQLSGTNFSGAGKTASPLRLVVFLVDHKTSHIVAVSEQKLNQ